MPATAAAAQVCGTVADFNQAMADGGALSTDVTLTFDVVGVDPNDFFGTKGSLAQFRDTTCANGADIGIKVYGPDDPPNDAHPPGTLKMEYGNTCCDGACGEHWADPNPSATIFVDGSEACTVTMWVNPMDAGYSLQCGDQKFDAVGGNPEANAVNEINLLIFLLPDGGSTWPIANATASNDQVCWEATPGDMMSVTVPVLEDVAATSRSRTTAPPRTSSSPCRRSTARSPAPGCSCAAAPHPRPTATAARCTPWPTTPGPRAR